MDRVCSVNESKYNLPTLVRVIAAGVMTPASTVASQATGPAIARRVTGRTDATGAENLGIYPASVRAAVAAAPEVALAGEDGGVAEAARVLADEGAAVHPTLAHALDPGAVAVAAENAVVPVRAGAGARVVSPLASLTFLLVSQSR